MGTDTVRIHFEQMSSEELLDIWTANDRDEYAEHTFTVISEILKERGIDVPPQITEVIIQPKKPWWRKIPGFRSGTKWKMVVATIIYLFIISRIFSGLGNSTPTPSTASSAPTSAPASTSATQNTSAATSTPTSPPTPAVKTYDPGMYKIGVDMPAGEYVLTSNDQAYFQVTKDSTGTLESIIANENFTNQTILTVNDGQYLTLRDCTAYAFKDAPAVQPVDGYLQEGMYKVGYGLSPGEYKVISEGEGYTEISSNSSHTLGSIISNDNFQGEKYITVQASQYLKLDHCKLKMK